MGDVLSYFTLKGEVIPIRDAETHEKLNNEIRDRKDENIKTNIRINNVELSAETANEIANTAKSTADSAITTANIAKSTADTASDTANIAKSTADIKMNAKVGFSSFLLTTNYEMAPGFTKTFDQYIGKQWYIPISMRYEISGHNSSMINVYSEIMTTEYCHLSVRNLSDTAATIAIKVTVYYVSANYVNI